MVLGILKKPLFKYKTIFLKRLNRGADMNEAAMLSGIQPREILQTVIEKKVPAVLSFLSGGKWHVVKVSLTNLGANSLDIRLSPRKTDSILQKSHQMPALKPPPINIQVNQPVGISLKYGYGKFIFETTVVAIQPSTEPTSGPTISLMVPERIELVQRRSYFRVDVPSSLKVNVMLWHRCYTNETSETQQLETLTYDSRRIPQGSYWQGKLTDISAGGVQIVVDTAQKPDFERGQFIGLRFTPMPYEMPLMFDAQIRNILPTADQKSISLGLRIVGLEASAEGRQVLQRICNVAEHYYQINQCTPKGRDFQSPTLQSSGDGATTGSAH
jgi:c-di-GMP-binding flagellar brake protein YcgR